MRQQDTVARTARPCDVKRVWSGFGERHDSDNESRCSKITELALSQHVPALVEDSAAEIHEPRVWTYSGGELVGPQLKETIEESDVRFSKRSQRVLVEKMLTLVADPSAVVTDAHLAARLDGIEDAEAFREHTLHDWLAAVEGVSPPEPDAPAVMWPGADIETEDASDADTEAAEVAADD